MHQGGDGGPPSNLRGSIFETPIAVDACDPQKPISVCFPTAQNFECIDDFAYMCLSKSEIFECIMRVQWFFHEINTCITDGFNSPKMASGAFEWLQVASGDLEDL